MKNRTNNLSDLNMIAKTVITDMRLAESFYYLLFKVLAPLNRVNKIKKNYRGLLTYSCWSLDVSYVVVLYKIFDRKQFSLPYFIKEIVLLDKERKNNLKSANVYNKFVKKSKRYLNKINQIEATLNPFRNTFRAHNYPCRKNTYKLNWNQTEQWFKWAENIFNEACIAVDIPPWAYFLDDGIPYEREALFNFLKKQDN